ncbi:MAG: 50S ribosomal protein L3 [Candidatus Walczuchella monophlebidarum]
MSGIIGKKIGMTSLFDEDGKHVSCTVIQAGPCSVIQIKTFETDGYSSVQLGFDNQLEKNVSKPLYGHFKKAGVYTKKKILEFSGEFVNNIKLGDEISINLFSEGEFVDVTGLSKGRGFQGVVKRHNFSGVGERTHGQHNRLRSPGSIGAGSDPSRVFKGTKMGGRMGYKNVTVKNLKVLKIVLERNIIVLKGSVPGNNNTYLAIKKWK